VTTMSGEGVRLELTRMPAASAGLVRAGLARKPGLAEGETIPRIEVSLPDVRTDAGRLQRYREVCGFQPGAGLPATYPHVLASPLHLAVLTRPEFPLPLVGLVHVRNEIRRERSLSPDEPLALRVWVEGHREVDAGLEFDFCTEAADTEGAVVWQATSTNLLRRRGRRSKRSGPPDTEGLELRERWHVPANIGRRYGRVAGDLNPIHLHPLTARMFGFRRAIAHGMWFHARAMAALVSEHEPEALHVGVAFRRPIFLPSTVVLRVAQQNGCVRHAVTDEGGGTVHMTGELTALGS